MNLTYAQVGHEMRCSNDNYKDIYFLFRCNKYVETCFVNVIIIIYKFYTHKVKDCFTVL